MRVARTAFPAYRSMITDWDEFQDSLLTPRPDTLRLNQWKLTPRQAEAYFRERGLDVRRSEWFSNLYYWRDPTRSASSTLLHWNGSYYLQDPVTLLPVEMMELCRGETVLDLCAAPGGKALYASEKVGPEGCVVANDPVAGRRKVLGSNIQRLGASNLVVTGYDGQSFPERTSFSAILADVPCSGEGTVRSSGRDPFRQSKERLRKLAETQYRILRKAYRVLEPGGRLMYATCSFAPEENEAVVDRLLGETDARIVPMDRGFPHDPGVIRWQNETFRPETARFWRCYPHHYDGGGLVFVKLVRPAKGSRP